MTPAELKTIREELGLSSQFVADLCGIQLRMAQRYEEQNKSVPNNVALKLYDIKVDLIERGIELADSFKDGGHIILYRYRNNEELLKYEPQFENMTASCHAFMVQIARNVLMERGVKTSIVFYDNALYESWIKQNGLKDGLHNRYKWAKAYYQENFE